MARTKKVEQPTRDPASLEVDERFFGAQVLEQFNAGGRDNAKLSDAVTACAMSEPSVRAASIIQKHDGNTNINALVDELRTQAAEVHRGNMTRAEAMLISQAHTLDALFSNLARRSYDNSAAGYLEAAERYMRLALKAQAQAVRTIEALGELKNPRSVAFVRQANIANGPQQVNNAAPSRAGEDENQRNKLGETFELLPDTPAAQAACRIDTPLEALGEIDRPEVARG